MQGLYDCLDSWQKTEQHEIISVNIQKDNENFCCIVLAYTHDLVPPMLTPYDIDMDKYRRKAMKRVGEGVFFESTVIHYEKLHRIKERLENCKTRDDVKAVFFEEY